MGDNSDVENFDDVLTVHLDGPGFQNNPPPPSPSIENVSRSKQQTPPKKTTPNKYTDQFNNLLREIFNIDMLLFSIFFPSSYLILIYTY